MKYEFSVKILEFNLIKQTNKQTIQKSIPQIFFPRGKDGDDI